MPAETTAFGSFFLLLLLKAAARIEQTRSGRCCCGCCCCWTPPPLWTSRRRQNLLKAVKVTDRCLMVSQDNLMSLPLFAHSAAALALLSSPSRARCTTPTTGCALQKGRAQGVLLQTRAGLQRRAERNGSFCCVWTLKLTAQWRRVKKSAPGRILNVERFFPEVQVFGNQVEPGQQLRGSYLVFPLLIFCYFNLVTRVEPRLLAQWTHFSTAFTRCSGEHELKT